ncbi:MAG: type II secretion system protein [Planctomycetota bacterium]|jgi:prepilin-type N-terminal cleavage/methylation domain-containing protein
MKRNRGFTLIELLTVMAIISLLIGLLLPALAQARAKAQLTKDQAQIKQIHTSWITFARDYEGAFPTPGLINRDQVDIGDGQGFREIPGRGPEDVERNISANMYSACIMQNYFTPQVVVAPTEPSGYVLVKDDYDWGVYKPLDDVYWDDTFQTDLDELCHASYAHMPIAGERKINQWKDSMDSKFAIAGNRGVEDGSLSADIYETSVTLEFHGGRKQWVGNICYNDNHLDLTQTFWPEGITYLDITQDPPTRPDNLFYNDTGTSQESGEGRDIWLTLISDIGSDGIDLTGGVEWD